MFRELRARRLAKTATYAGVLEGIALTILLMASIVAVPFGVAVLSAFVH